jgi:hypothetical protein
MDLKASKAAGHRPWKLGAFARGCDRERQGVHPPRQFFGQYCVDAPLALDTAETAEGFRPDFQAKMAFPAGPRPGMTRMKVRFIDDHEVIGGESCFDLRTNGGGNGSSGGRWRVGHGIS